jgi:hypothetical protein
MADNTLLLSYSVLDGGYRNGLIKKIEGQPAGSTAEVASIANPDETYVPLGPTESDPKIFSYAYGHDPAILIARVSTSGGTSTALYTLAAPEAGCGKAWKVLGRDIVLKSGGGNIATNPFGVAQVGNMLYIIEYDTRKITMLGVNELNGVAAGDHPLAYTPYDLTGPAGLTADAHGQAIIALNNGGIQYLFALFTVSNNSSYPPVFQSSVLVRMTVAANGSPVYQSKLDTLALNAQELIFTSAGGTNSLFIPALGGAQKSDGTTNGIASTLDEVDPFAATMVLLPRITGDNTPSTPTTWDIRAFAAPPSGTTINNPQVYLLTGTMDQSYNQNWDLYSIPLTALRALSGETITQALSSGLDQTDGDTNDPGNFWDIFYEAGTGASAQGGRLWFLKGSPIYITAAQSYGAPDKLFDTGYADGDIGGINVDSVTLVTETMKQVALGVSLKRGLRGIAPVLPPAEEAEEEK